MNERIKDMLEQPVFDRLRDWYNIGPVQRATLEEFAELIVKECVRYFNEDYHRDFDTLWREDLSKGIKQHFGVEE